MDKKNEPDYIKRMHEELDTLGLHIEKLKAFYNTRYMRRLTEFSCYLLDVRDYKKNVEKILNFISALQAS